MSRAVQAWVGIFILLTFVALSSISVARAESQLHPKFASSPIELVNAVNGLRASYGLPPYSINPILMSTAQAQADFLAVTGNMTHSGPGGISFTDRLLAAGYPLAGDLSLGGFRAENITGGPEDMPAEAAVNRWTGDVPHLTTMISPDLTEIGAGVALNNGRVYYVIDCARPTASGEPQGPSGSLGAGTAAPVASPPGIIYPISLSTPNAGGELIHEVKPGQSLWLIAIAYETKIDDIKRLNNLFDNNIYPGKKLLIKTGLVVATASPTASPMQEATFTATSLPASTAATATPIAASSSASTNNAAIMRVAMGIIALALLGGGIITWLGSAKKK